MGSVNPFYSAVNTGYGNYGTAFPGSYPNSFQVPGQNPYNYGVSGFAPVDYSQMQCAQFGYGVNQTTIPYPGYGGATGGEQGLVGRMFSMFEGLFSRLFEQLGIQWPGTTPGITPTPAPAPSGSQLDSRQYDRIKSYLISNVSNLSDTNRTQLLEVARTNPQQFLQRVQGLGIAGILTRQDQTFIYNVVNRVPNHSDGSPLTPDEANQVNNYLAIQVPGLSAQNRTDLVNLSKQNLPQFVNCLQGLVMGGILSPTDQANVLKIVRGEELTQPVLSW